MIVNVPPLSFPFAAKGFVRAWLMAIGLDSILCKESSEASFSEAGCASVIGHGILAGKYLAEYHDLLK